MRIWFLTQRLPYAPNRGDRIRSYHILQFLRRRADVDVFSLVHDEEERGHAAALEREVSSVTTATVPKWRNRVHGALSLPSQRPLTLSLLDAPVLRRALADRFPQQRPDVVLAYCSSMAAYAMEGPLASVPLVIDMVDVDSMKWRALTDTNRMPKRWLFAREARCLRDFERRAMEAAVATVAVNEREVADLREINPRARAFPVLNGISLDSYAPPSVPSPSTSVVFCGVLDYEPNETAALRLAEQIWPLVIRQRPDARLLLVGANPTARIRRAAAGDATVHVTGSVPDVRPYLWRSAVAAVPLITARGVQNKVLEAVAAGLPTVVSPVVAAGLPDAVVPGTAVARTDEEFAAAIVEWLAQSPESRRARAAACDLTQLGWERQIEPLWHELQDAVGESRRPSEGRADRRPAHVA
jgi:sugar transferase (PEP-CTERM/EpsH1 system associated)